MAAGSVAWSTYGVTPASTQAGANSNIAVNLVFKNTGGDTVKGLTLHWAAGIAAAPAAALTCSTTQFAAEQCPAGSLIAKGQAHSLAIGILPLPLPADLYMLPAAPGQLAGLGLIVSLSGLVHVHVLGNVTLRTSPDVGVDINFPSIPNHVLSVLGIQIQSVALTVQSTVNGAAFTRNPTSCAAEASTAVLTSYAVATPLMAPSNAFQATGCSSLGFKPSVSGSVTPDGGDNGVATSLSINQNEGSAITGNDAALQNFTMTFPSTVTPNLVELGTASGQQVGTVSVATPLLASPLTGVINLEPSTTGGLPTLQVLIAAPAPLTFTVNLSLGAGNQVSASLSGLPDLPLSSIAISLPGGTNSLLQSNSSTGTTANLNSTFMGWNGASATSSTPFPS